MLSFWVMALCNHLIVAKPLFYPCRTVLALAFFKDFTKEMVTDYVFFVTGCCNKRYWFVKIQFKIGSLLPVICRQSTHSSLEVAPFISSSDSQISGLTKFFLNTLLRNAQAITNYIYVCSFFTPGYVELPPNARLHQQGYI